MKSSITATIEFYFKGEKHTPSITRDMDELMQASGNMPDLCMLIAQENNFDLYSYEYEMMQAEQIIFSDAQGLVKDYVTNGALDVQAFELAWQENNVKKAILEIVLQNEIPEALQNHPGFEKALIEVYQLGESGGRIKNQ